MIVLVSYSLVEGDYQRDLRLCLCFAVLLFFGVGIFISGNSFINFMNWAVEIAVIASINILLESSSYFDR